jgi:transcriptional regulator GlxA family with amidase domain
MNGEHIERTLGKLQSRLLDHGAQGAWSEHLRSELLEAVHDCLRHVGVERRYAPPAEPRLERDTLRRVIRYVKANIDSKLTWDLIAAEVGMDRFTFGRRFKLTTRITPHQYVTRCRLKKAKKLLADGDASLADIALDIGCSCQSHFTTLFRQHVGTTPGEFRRRAAHRAPNRSRALPAVSIAAA